jgi:hypothetical protein
MVHHSNILAVRLPLLAAFCLAALLNAGCGSNPVQGQWTDPQFANHSLRGEKVLVVCDSSEAAVKRICEDQMREQLSAAGAVPVTAADERNATGTLRDRSLAAARSAGARAVLVSTVAPEVTTVNPGPSVGIGVGGFGGFGGWRSGGIGTGVGVSVPVGANRVDTAYAANIVLTDVQSGRVMWTSKVGATGRQDINQQIAAIAKNGIDAAQHAGVF